MFPAASPAKRQAEFQSGAGDTREAIALGMMLDRPSLSEASKRELRTLGDNGLAGGEGPNRADSCAWWQDG
jgi:hypothetical protein